MSHVLVLDPIVCSGCRTCEIACSLYHNKDCNPEKSRIRVIKFESRGVFTPVTCIHCETALCENVCPMRALKKNPNTGTVELNEEICIGCKLCIYVCPLAAPLFDADRNVVVKCDLCGGDPQCVKLCTTKALQYISVERLSILLKRKGANKLMDFQTLMTTERSE